MSNTLKGGIDYAGWKTDIFDNESSPIDDLLDAQGWVGFGVYFFLCQRAYKTDGYFYRWNFNNAASTARKMGGGVKADTVKQVVSLCLQKGLFDNRLFDREGILTNREIQTRYMLAIEKRSKNARTINKGYWLLEKKETKAYVIIPENADSLPENTTKESKVKESKVLFAPAARGKHNNVNLSAEDYQTFVDEYGKAVIDEYIDKISDYIVNSGKKPFKNHAVTLKNWLTKDGVKKLSEQSIQLHSYNLDEILRNSLQGVQ